MERPSMNEMKSTPARICVDMGTTNTRLWLVQGTAILARYTEERGLRNAAQARDRNLISGILRTLIQQAEADASKLCLNIECILAAGMLTSRLGIREVPHVPAPAGEEELARALQRATVRTVSELAFYLVPGVRTGGVTPELAKLHHIDLIRGEETTVVGLMLDGVLPRGASFLNLGSHWKIISIDRNGRIAASRTTLSGELIHAIQEHTILASALPRGRFLTLKTEWFERGRAYQADEGLGRSLFSVRVLEQIFHIDTLEASSFLLGAMIESELTAMQDSGKLGEHIVIGGMGAAAEGWAAVLAEKGKSCVCCGQEQVEAAFVLGLQRIFQIYADRNDGSGRLTGTNLT
jgi:2-dehydro-3-deoxygalactonokinase